MMTCIVHLLTCRKSVLFERFFLKVYFLEEHFMKVYFLKNCILRKNIFQILFSKSLSPKGVLGTRELGINFLAAKLTRLPTYHIFRAFTSLLVYPCWLSPSHCSVPESTSSTDGGPCLCQGWSGGHHRHPSSSS